MMDFQKCWTKFSVEAEVEAYGVDRVVNAHNLIVFRLRDEIAALKARVAELEAAWSAVNDLESAIKRAQDTIKMLAKRQ